MDMKSKILFSVVLLALFGCATQTTQETSSEGTSYFSAESEPAEKEQTGITREDVSEHDTLESCYVIINDLVYDVTDYVEFSPSFKDTGMTHDEFRARLTDSCGDDGTILFREVYGDNHYRLDSYLIGQL